MKMRLIKEKKLGSQVYCFTMKNFFQNRLHFLSSEASNKTVRIKKLSISLKKLNVLRLGTSNAGI